MAKLLDELYLIREVGTDNYLAGYGNYAVPKLYKKNSINSVVGKLNKSMQEAMLARRYEAVPVSVIPK